MEEVFRLQQSVEQIGHDETKGLEKICFAPMVSSDQEPDSVSQCVVQSIFGYFGNSIDTFRKSDVIDGYTVNYLNTLDNCIMLVGSIYFLFIDITD